MGEETYRTPMMTTARQPLWALLWSLSLRRLNKLHGVTGRVNGVRNICGGLGGGLLCGRGDRTSQNLRVYTTPVFNAPVGDDPVGI